MTDGTKVIAFYLPQFHPVAENDAWWGHGFTEWTKVVKARPLGPDHYQPHLPGELGFYDLRVPEVRERQAAMARRHGIDGFMYYHCWFGGEQVLDRTFNEVLSSGRPDFPFSLCWANENWTRVWDAGEKAILLEQRYGPEERAAHIDWIIKAFRDPRYIRIGGRPLFAIYRIQSLPDSEGFVSELRSATGEAGIPDPYLVKFDTHGRFDDPAVFGCDAAAQFLPHGVFENIQRAPTPIGFVPNHHYVHYDDVVDTFSELPPPAWVRHEAVFPGWDNTARRQEQLAIVVLGNTPERYEEWLRVVHGRAPERGGVVFINAWNEWGEGAHLEPDDRWQDAFLRATARVTLGDEAAARLGLPPDEVDEEEVICGPTFAELYLDVYERYVRARHRLTSFDESLRREVARRTEMLSLALAAEKRRSGELEQELTVRLELDRERQANGDRAARRQRRAPQIPLLLDDC